MPAKTFKLLILSSLLLFAALQSKAFTVCFKFNGYAANYCMDEYSPVYTGKGIADTCFELDPGTHTFIVNGYVSSELSFNVDSNGGVSILSNPIAASVSNKGSVDTISFNTAQISIDPQGAVYSFSPFYLQYPVYQLTQSTETFTLIKGFEYFIATEYSGDYISIPNIPNYYIPEVFFFYVDKKGDVSKSKQNKNIVDNLTASYSGSTVTLKTVKIDINATDFKASAVRIAGYEYFTKKKISFIKGLGITIFYGSSNPQASYYFIPL
jgi:hypothetical protein